MSAIRRPDDVLRTYLSMSAIGFILLGWLLGVLVQFDLPKAYFFQGLFYAGKATLTSPLLWIGPFLGMVVALVVYIVGFNRWKTSFQGPEFINHLRGTKMVSPWMLRSKTKEDGKQLMLGGIPIPKILESTHFLIGGSTGTGKSIAINEYLESAIARGDRIICVDPDGAFMQYHYQEGDSILNPFDARGLGWKIFNEIRNDFDCEQYAMAMIPRSPATDQEQWNSMARTIITETLAVLMRSGQNTTERLVYWLTQAPNDDLQTLLAATPAAGCFHGAEETLASIRTVLTRYITPHKYLPEGDFSFRKWLEESEGSIWITWREDMLQALKPLISCWVDVTCASVLSVPEDEAKPTHLVCDEVDSLEKLNYMVDAGTKGRKHGLRIVIGLQSLAQLDATWGVKDAMTLRNVMRTTLLLGVGSQDTYTAAEFAKGVGAHEVVRRKVSSTGGKRNVSIVSIEEPIVRPVEFTLLPNLEGYLNLAQAYPLAKIKLARKDRQRRIKPIELSKVFSESPMEPNRLFDLRA